MTPWVQERLGAACESEGVRPLAFACGAGHDAAVFAAMGVATGMLLIRNEHGSHNPDEHMRMEDFAVAANVLSRFCLMAPGAP